jgi:MFS family permease
MKTASTDPLEHQRLQEKAKDADQRYNFNIALLQGIMIRISFAFASGTTVLSTFIHTLTQNNVLVGLTGSIMTAGWMWPQLLMSNLIEHRPRKLRFYVFGMSGRVFAWLAIFLCTLFIGSRNYKLLAGCFLFFYFVGTSSMGVSTIPYMDIISKAIEPQRRARFFSLRQFIGLIFEFFIGFFFIKYILSERSGLTFPTNYAVLFGCTWVAVVGAFFVFMKIREPIRPVHSQRKPIWEHLKRGPYFLKKDKHYRRFLMFRVCGHFIGMSSPFYAPYALQKFEVPESTIGLFVATMALSGVVSNIVWGHVGEKYGTIWILRITAALFCIPPLIAFTARFFPPTLQVPWYFLAFAVSGFTTAGTMVGFMTYMLNIAPSLSRPTYIGFMNTLLFPFGFVPVLGGALVSLIAYEGVFAISVAMGVLAFIMTMRLEEVVRSDSDEDII